MAAAAEAAAVAAAAARTAFAYNRENYMFDMGLRWGRFTTGYSMAMAQASMYREDIRDLTALTVTKQDTYHTVGVIFFVLNFQLIMAGRLGVHGPSPPGWLLGLYWTNICAALMYLVTFTWMAMHASARATAGGAFMLTRHVRLPIPTPKMLDEARKTGNSYEKQRVADVLRIPFAMPAAQETEEDPETGARAPASDRRMPKWYQDEVADLRKDGGGAAAGGRESNPEHFELYRGLQEEWWAHDVYSRIGVLYFMSHWLTSASLYSMCHVFTELRCIWPAYTVTSCFVAAHYGILKLDIVAKPREGGSMGVPMEKVVPFVPYLCVVAMTIDYSILPVSPVWQGIVYFLSWIAYIIQFAWALRLYDLAAPQLRMKDRDEQPGQSWWPAEWPLPPAFEDAIYMVAAPKHSEQPCVQQEMKAAKGKKRYEVEPVKAKRAPPPMFVWKLFRGACITTISMWVLIMVGRVFEQVNGERWLLKQEGRVERWPSHMQPWMTPWSRQGSRNEFCHAGGCDRRLSATELQQQQNIASLAQQLSSALGPLAEALDNQPKMPPQAAKMAPMPRAASVAWPMGFAPAHIASNGAIVAAISKTHEGALLRFREEVDEVEDVAKFSLHGIDGLGEVIGTTWGPRGLVLATSLGAIAECLGSPLNSLWACQRAAVPSLPTGLTSAVVGHHESSGVLRAAVKFEDEDSVLLLELDAATDSWLPSGEIRVPSPGFVHLSLSPQADEVVISSADGSVHRRSLNIGEQPHIEQVAPAHFVAPGMTWHGACGMSGGRFAHLAAQGSPKLFVSGVSTRTMS